MIERRCGHGFLRSKVTCKACDRIDFLLERARAEREKSPPVHRAVRHLPPASTEYVAGPHEVVEAVAAAYRIPAKRIIERDRQRHVADARIACFWLMRKLTILSWPNIGMVIGNRDHTTAMAGFRAAEKLRRTSVDFCDRTDRILKSFEEKKGAAA